MNDNVLKFTALSGTISVTENLYVYETKNDMLVVDCGVGFPDLEMPGIELVLPDFSYIVKNKAKLRGIVLSQGHEDHIGAVPYLLQEVSVPVWGAPLTVEFLQEKFRDFKISKTDLRTFHPERDEFEVGSFKVSPFRVTHSLPDACGFAIDTPAGRIFHVPEHKMNQDPVDGMPFDIARAKKLAGEKENLFLASDCLGANKPGFTESEQDIEKNMLAIVQKAKQAVFTTAISSNIGRFQQMVNVAQKTGRKVIFVGRSIITKTQKAHKLGYLKYLPGSVIQLRDAQQYGPHQLMYVVSGCYGQEGSSLYRLSTGEYDGMETAEGDMMVFSANPAPPHTKESQNSMVDDLIDRGVDVHYHEVDEGLYVSGHGKQEDIKALFNIVKPKYFIPIGGEIRYMHAYEKLVLAEGHSKDQVFKLKPGDNITFEGDKVTKGQRIHIKSVLVHGRGIGDIGKVVLGDRSVLGTEGVVVIIFKVDKNKKLVENPQIVTRGFVYQGKSRNLLNDATARLASFVKAKNTKNIKALKDDITRFLENHFYKVTARKPMILPVVVEV
ncbi:ribonuclease J [Candidatus Microgenomates bacterium]|nr:ribonuclease J [Candidatus Microgenomates bacterium]